MLIKDNLPKIAYFSMEYGLNSSMKTYAGGLGVLAGDYIKGAKDYEFPVTAIGIKWKQGYGEQLIGENDSIYSVYNNGNYDFLKDTGIKVTARIWDRTIFCKVWKVDCFGNVPLYLLDTDIPENDDRWITDRLYGGDEDDRIAQEMVLGIGGIRALRALGIDADVYHFNEGHAVFAGFELIREKMEKSMSFEDALACSRKEIVFTTHTPVMEGNEAHSIEKIVHMGANNGLTPEQVIKIGGCPFNMTVAALRMSRISNAVSEIHRQTASKMWSSIYNRSQIIGITNAIHVPTWVDKNMIEAAEGNGDLWQYHMKNKKQLIEYIKNNTGIEMREDVLTIGFSRRATSYKRNNFIMYDESVIGPMLNSGKLQLVFSGKAHPQDGMGRGTIEHILKTSKRYPGTIVFLKNYDMDIGKVLTRGCDVWLNNPRKPKEASGTSGMKAAMNGVLNLSILDGWWSEACIHGVNGWQFGDGYENQDTWILDSSDLKSLYDTLQYQVLPVYYYDRNQWVEMMKNSILSTKDIFSVKRMIEEYYEKMYMV